MINPAGIAVLVVVGVLSMASPTVLDVTDGSPDAPFAIGDAVVHRHFRYEGVVVGVQRVTTRRLPFVEFERTSARTWRVDRKERAQWRFVVRFDTPRGERDYTVDANEIRRR